MNELMNSSCRVALAAYLHDMGKFAERARIPEANDKVDSSGNTRAEIEKQLNCPTNREGRPTHVHAAYTAIGMDILEDHLPDIVGDDMSPFAPWRNRNTDNSIINAAARHHRPDTFLQWIIATADRLASGFEREEFEEYNLSTDDEQKKLNHYTTRQWTLLEHIHLGNRPETRDWRYPLKGLSPKAIFPVAAKDCEADNNAAAQAHYLSLWSQFLDGMKKIPASHRQNLALWLDHFDTLWLTFTHAIPSATAGIGGNVRPDVSLYDHSKTTAALAVAIWRYHADQGHDVETTRQQLRAQWDMKRAGSTESKTAWDTEKFLLVQGDFFGIQDFIFAEGGQTQKRAAKLLRGRSFYVSLISELAALKILEVLDLPATSQVVNAAGKFLIVAPNTTDMITKLQKVQKELDAWFLEHTYGQSGIGLAWLPAKANDFRHGKEEKESPFRKLIERLFRQLEEAKLTRFNLCNSEAVSPIFDGFLDRFGHGECKIDGKSPAMVEKDGVWMSQLAADQINAGKWLATQKRVLISSDSLDHHTLKLPVFGFRVNFTESEGDTGKFGNEARTGNLLRAWDFSLPQSFNAPLWNGYARRHINAYVPQFGELNAWEADRYHGIENQEEYERRADEIKTLNHIACDDKMPLFDEKGIPLKTSDERDRFKGVAALMTLKGDVDNLGQIFEKGLARPTFARMAGLSRQVNAFFTVYLPWLCKSEFPNTYTVFAGGDDFFLIGPWHSTIKLAQRMKDDFKRYVAQNPDIHFSAGLSMTKPGLPIRQLANLVEKALDNAKSFNPDQKHPLPKNAVTCFDHRVAWEKFDELMNRKDGLERVAGEYVLSMGYLYGLLHLADMAEETRKYKEAFKLGEQTNISINNSLWQSRFAYRTRRFAESRIKSTGDREATEEKRRRLQADLGTEIAGLGIEQHGAAYKIALYTYLYQQRD